MTLPTPPTPEQRLDAAAEAAWNGAWKGQAGIEWADEPPDEKRTWRRIVESVCRAFAPEHFKDTDTTTGKD